MAIKNGIEAILFISARPMSVKRLAKLVEVEEAAVVEALAALAREYQEREGGLAIVQHEGEVQVVTASAEAPVIQRFIKDETTGELTKPSLEALTIIAYRGPITKVDLEKIRGVNCSLILRNLMMRGLVEQVEDPRRLVSTYTVSVDFLRFLGLTSLAALPDYERLHSAEAIERFLAQEEPADSAAV